MGSGPGNLIAGSSLCISSEFLKTVPWSGLVGGPLNSPLRCVQLLKPGPYKILLII